MRALEPIVCTRVVATPAALDTVSWPMGAVVLRVAPDEALVTAEVTTATVPDPHAIVERETGFVAAWVESRRALELLEQFCTWELPHARPAFAQGAVAGLPVKLWFDADRVLILVPAPFATDFAERVP